MERNIVIYLFKVNEKQNQNKIKGAILLIKKRVV